MARTAGDILEQEFLQTRAKLLEVAAFFDRLQKAAGQVTTGALTTQADLDGTRLGLLIGGLDLLQDSQGDKAARLQMLFSRHYEADWREQFDLPTSR